MKEPQYKISFVDSPSEIGGIHLEPVQAILRDKEGWESLGAIFEPVPDQLSGTVDFAIGSIKKEDDGELFFGVSYHPYPDERVSELHLPQEFTKDLGPSGYAWMYLFESGLISGDKDFAYCLADIQHLARADFQKLPVRNS